MDYRKITKTVVEMRIMMMSKLPRMVKGEDAICHNITRTTLPGYVSGDVQKDYLVDLIKLKSDVFF